MEQGALGKGAGEGGAWASCLKTKPVITFGVNLTKIQQTCQTKRCRLDRAARLTSVCGFSASLASRLTGRPGLGEADRSERGLLKLLVRRTTPPPSRGSREDRRSGAVAATCTTSTTPPEVWKVLRGGGDRTELKSGMELQEGELT